MSTTSKVNKNLKMTGFQKRFFSGKPVEEVQHTLEDRVRRLAERFAAIEAGIAELGSGGADAPAPAAAASSSSTSGGGGRSAADCPNLDPSKEDTPEVAKLRAHCKDIGLYSATFKWVPSEYYDHPLVWRREKLGAPSVNFLCKSIVLENTRCASEDCSNINNSRYYIAVFQYVERFDAEKVLRFVKGMNEGVGKKQFNFRLADPEKSQKMTGFGHNAVVPFGTVEKIPVIVSQKIVELSPKFFWLGGGHVDAKVRVDTEEFLDIVKPFVADITNSYSDEELANLVGK